jgi:hypothetical protein
MSHQAGTKALQKAPSNEWIAFSEDDERLIACGATYDEVVANAEKQGASDLVVVKVPETWIYRVSVANGAARARNGEKNSVLSLFSHFGHGVPAI